MKLRLVLKIATISSVVLICITLAVTLYFKMSQIGKAQEFNLYALVPKDASVIVDTDNLFHLFHEINELSCSKDDHFLYFSKFFSQLKEHINKLVAETPHGFSKQMDKMLISFHEPDNKLNQVFYCRLGIGDKDLAEEFIRRYCGSSFPSKYLDYKGEEICIYPVADDTFLSCYITQEFLAISYQKKLIENVIDAYLNQTSILSDPSFPDAGAAFMPRIPARIYVRMQSMNMGKAGDGLRSASNLGGWSEFTMKMNSHAIYFSGINYDTDTVVNFVNTMRKQELIKELPEKILPASTFYFNKRSISDVAGMLDFTSAHNYIRAISSDYTKQRDKELINFIEEYSAGSITACMFLSRDSLPADTLFVNVPCAVLNMPVRDSAQAEQFLRNLLKTIPVNGQKSALPENQIYHTPSGTYRFMALPHNTILSQLAGITDMAHQPFACFYDDNWLIAPDSQSLKAYIDAIEADYLLEDDPGYKESIVSLSDSYCFLMLSDLGKALEQPAEYLRLIPGFFLRHSYFFKYFIFSAQFTCVDDVIYPNLVLIYKGREYIDEDMIEQEEVEE